jgi:endonuclease YncB( thermonuclease family)
MFLNRELVKRGLAWHYKEYSDDQRLADDEDNARLKKLGKRATERLLTVGLTWEGYRRNFPGDPHEFACFRSGEDSAVVRASESFW